MPLNITGRKDQGGYRCTAYNGIGDLDTADVFIAVQSKSISIFYMGIHFPLTACLYYLLYYFILLFILLIFFSFIMLFIVQCYKVFYLSLKSQAVLETDGHSLV